VVCSSLVLPLPASSAAPGSSVRMADISSSSRNIDPSRVASYDVFPHKDGRHAPSFQRVKHIPGDAGRLA
jgi:hypothetical protein